MIFKNDAQKASVFFLMMIFLFLFFYVLAIGASFIIPFVIALLFSMAIISLSSFYMKFVKTPYITFPLSVLTYIAIFYIIGEIINANIKDIMAIGPQYQDKIMQMIAHHSARFGVDTSASMEQFFSYINVSTIVGGIVGALSTIVKSAGIIFIYTLFLLFEHRYFGEKLKLMISNEEKQQKFLFTIQQIKEDVRSYFMIKSIASLSTGVLSYAILMMFSVDFALFWAFIIFLLNFIPAIGSIIAVSFPVLFAVVQFDSLSVVLALTIALVCIQVLIGNIIEPKIMGNRLNLSPVVIVLALGFWGIIWGVVGMLLSIPIMVIINIIFSKSEMTRPISIFLSEKGELKIDLHPFEEGKQILTRIKEKMRKKKKWKS